MRVEGGRSLALLLAAVLTVSACSGDKEPRLLNIKSTQGPDEFSILPGKPLQAPPDFATLPEPTPGGSNLTDPTPDQDAVAALGGNPSVLTRSGIPAADTGLLNHAGRYGIQAGIRDELAAADLEYRRKNDGRLLERLFNVNVYFKAYRPYELDQYAELARLRRLGLKTPAAPPDPAR
ncbi:DUF3035 domain-containing protein [Frigidibacter sp. ROC022]|uniref:DUF3035 domain-containing protein n=1 Tax=Frigidibacter sp. ROC022 TaxID=2971796 RepID=UPI00215B4A31|nr:DUF3035 domain-containing protein [Frigidibacter sp. ROC022]MCR8724883.1 DUF3035 domain-containing protein [Frigidibacter sp. ROC022]